MDSLPLEVQIDILKYLNFKQLISMQQTNSYFNHLINDNENQLARKKFSFIRFTSLLDIEIHMYECKPFNPEPKLYEFELSKELEEKWKCGIEKSMPLFFVDDVEGYGQVACILNKNFGDERSFWDDLIDDYNTSCMFEFIKIRKVRQLGHSKVVAKLPVSIFLSFR
ncbi:unnamed protein product [Meloidogyne enterolobii]|uniref:Uncharacterized protein n=1 Tax=Meloidogyne enterolobii TaxID=390850 RepID=A0ACB0YVH4_MELEN